VGDNLGSFTPSVIVSKKIQQKKPQEKDERIKNWEAAL
jgi:hypothetical protein